MSPSMPACRRANHAIKIAKQTFADMKRDTRAGQMSNEARDRSFFARDRDWHPPAYTPGYKTSVLRSPQKRR